MRPRPNRFRLLAASLAASLIATPPLPAMAQAQGPDGPEGPLVTPPSRVGRLGWVRGQVSMRPNGAQQWEPAVVNYPLSAGDAVWTQPGATAGVEVSATGIDLASGTEFDLDALDATSLTGTLPQGEAVVRVHHVFDGERYILQTPRGTVTLASPGDYEIAAGTTDSPTLVTVFQGQAEVTGQTTIDLHAGQTAMISGDQTFAVQITPAMHDTFADRMLTPPRPRRYAVAPPPLVAAMPGGEDLDNYGAWAPNPEYGPVWYPRVAPGWVPYREGHWAYVAPWGWTWIDSEPWGFAPFHYGRWVEVGPRWGWVPGSVVVAEAPPYPVYAPALVAFFTVGGGFAAGLTVGALVGGSVGWVPLGPREAYHPYFRASPAYVREVNIREVRNVTNITNVTVNQVTINRFRNQRGATVVPAGALVASRPVGPLARPGAAGLLASSRPVLGRSPVAPATTTLGVTPALARAHHIAPLTPQVARQLPRALAPVARPVAPGPALRSAAARPGTGGAGLVRPGGGAPPLAVPLGRGPVGTSQPAGTPPGTVRPGLVRPGLVPPGAVRPGIARPGIAPPGTARPVTPPPSSTRPPAPSLRAPGAHPNGFPARPQGPGTAPLPRVITPGPAAPRPGIVSPARPAPAPALRPPGATPAYRAPPAAAHPAPLARPVPAIRAPAPAYHPPAPASRAPAPAYHPPAPAYHPPAPAPRAQVPAYHPPAPAYHPPAPAYRAPPPAYHPPAPAYHPPAPAYRPPPPAYHPPAPAYHPPAPAQHPPPPARDPHKPQ